MTKRTAPKLHTPPFEERLKNAQEKIAKILKKEKVGLQALPQYIFDGRTVCSIRIVDAAKKEDATN
jgi:hypothetical protein